MINTVSQNPKIAMIFQQSIPLGDSIPNVYVVFDHDTGSIGFVENGEHSVEYSFLEAPLSYRTAFMNLIEPLSDGRTPINTKICRKSEFGKYIQEYKHDD